MDFYAFFFELTKKTFWNPTEPVKKIHSKAYRIERYKSKISTSKNANIKAKYFHAWRFLVKRKKDIEKLEQSEALIKQKMEKLLEKLKNPQKNQKLEIVDLENEVDITPIEAWKQNPESEKKSKIAEKICLKIDAPKNVYKNRHEAQTLIIENQKSKIQKQEQQIQFLINEKLHNSKKGVQNVETILRVDSPKEKKEKSLTEFEKQQFWGFCCSGSIFLEYSLVGFL